MSMSAADEIPVEYQLVHDATLWGFEVTKIDIEPTAGSEDFSVCIELQVEKDGIEHCAFPLVSPRLVSSTIRPRS